ncbi:nitroreductase family protein [Patescibacteria group bacterium]|nr:nitroreductase family protein [Patescibacteria group bacterium]
MNHTFLSNLEWRFATKKFDPDKEVRQGDLEKILQAIRFAPASRGLQPYHVIVIQDDQLKRELYPIAKNQT